MTPARIIRQAIEKGLDMIAISDHNSAENIETALSVASGYEITVLPAMEVTSSEEAHVLAFFNRKESVFKMQETVYSSLPEESGDRGEEWQVLVNEKDEVMGFNRKLLIGATSLSLKEIVNEIHILGGLAVASHVDRGAFSVMSQMGFVPEDIDFDAFEVIDNKAAEQGLMFHPGVPRVKFSDAHNLNDINTRNTAFIVEEATFEELTMAVKDTGGRYVEG
jgi:predicted metal-dependent phosphoesterase TrpH